MKKFFFSFILILTCLLPFSVCAENDLINCSFSSERDAVIWSGCFYDETISFGEGYCAFVTNPFGEVKNDTVTHVIDYTDKIHLEAGKIYTLSGYVMNPLNDYNQSIRTNARLESGANTIIATINGADADWSEFSTTFYAGETGEFNLSIHFTQGNLDFGFFIDEITLKETPYTLSAIGVIGPDEILIPVGESIKTTYTPYLIATDSTEINILSSDSVTSSCTQIKGVEYNPYNFTLTLNGDASPNTAVTLDFALKNYANLSLFSKTVTLTDTLIRDSSFEDGNIMWTSTSEITQHTDGADSYISLPTNDYGNFGYFSTLTYTVPQLLVEGKLYVIRAKVKSDVSVPISSIYAKNTSFSVDNTVYFDINNIDNEWSEVFSAFIPEASGIYTISINLYSIYDCTVYVDDIRLCSEIPTPEYITLHAPGNIAIPDVKTEYPVSSLLRDQLGNIIDTDRVHIYIENKNNSFDFDENTLTVYPDTLSGEYILCAYYIDNPSISTKLPITVSFDYIGDGTFEEKLPNEWWMATSPYESILKIRNDGISKRALINCNGDYFILLNNSYIHLIKDTPYVFNSEFSSAVDCTVTLFAETLDAEVIPLAQFHVPGGTTLGEKLTPELFLAEEDAVGRLFLYIQSDNLKPFTIYTDNLSLKKASILASNPTITGTTYVNGAAEASFSFYNNVAQNSDVSSCIVNWYVSSKPDSGFTMLGDSGKNIYFDTTYLNKYVYFEVIPVCPITGFSGEAVRSSVVKITYDSTSENSVIPAYIPTLKTPAPSGFFEDTTSHWAKEYIDILAYNGIINGKTPTTYAPKDYITRAEFAKLISTAFSIKTDSDFSQFTDIKKSDWFYSYVSALNLADIVHGTSSTGFSPRNTITREDSVTILMRVYEKFEKLPQSVSLSDFSDYENISSYAINSIGAAKRLGIVQGTSSGQFCPDSPVTRAEAAALLYRTIIALD